MYSELNIWKIDTIDIPRIDEVCEFRIQVFKERGDEAYKSMPSYEIMCEYSWIPLEFENWSGKQFKEISETKQLFLAIKYRFFCKYKVK